MGLSSLQFSDGCGTSLVWCGTSLVVQLEVSSCLVLLLSWFLGIRLSACFVPPLRIFHFFKLWAALCHAENILMRQHTAGPGSRSTTIP